jgi:hypothetical protein
MYKLVHAWGQERLDVEQQRHLSLVALELLIDAIPSGPGSPMFGMRVVPHVMANFFIVSGTNMVSAAIKDESLDSVALVCGFFRDLGR